MIKYVLCLIFIPLFSKSQITIDSLKTWSIKGGNGVNTVSIQQPIVLEFDQNNIQVSFSGSSKPLYYQLEGLNKQWIPIENVKHLQFANLSGGNYIFRVKPFKNESEIVNLPFSIELPFWDKWWFWPLIFVYVVFAVSTVLRLFYVYRFRQQIKLLRIRNNIAADLHDEVGATLTSIGISTKVLQKKLSNKTPEIASILAQMSTDAQDSVQNIRDTVWSINPENDTFEKLVEKVHAFALQVLTIQDIAVDFDNQLKPEKVPKLGVEQRRNIYLILKEAINNVAKHAGSTKVLIKIKHHQHKIQWIVEDNGSGFDKAKTFEGNGLKFFKKRANESGIDFTIHSVINKGTTISLIIG